MKTTTTLTSTRHIAHRASRMYESVDRAADRIGVAPAQIIDGQRLYREGDADKILKELSVADRRKPTDTETAALR